LSDGLRKIARSRGDECCLQLVETNLQQGAKVGIWRTSQDAPSIPVFVGCDQTAEGIDNAAAIADEARVLFRTDGTAFGVFAFLCGDTDVAPHLILHNRELAYFKVVGIRPFAPGRYRTACGRGLIDCYAGEPHEVRLDHAAIDYFKNESVTSLFYWSEDEQGFKWVAVKEGGVSDDAVASTK
jgi:hypothetical protein